MTVVEDSSDCIALYLAPGTRITRPVQLDGAPIPRSLPFEERFRLPRRTGDDVWRDT